MVLPSCFTIPSLRSFVDISPIKLRLIADFLPEDKFSSKSYQFYQSGMEASTGLVACLADRMDHNKSDRSSPILGWW
jgi:hypothetical protein